MIDVGGTSLLSRRGAQLRGRRGRLRPRRLPGRAAGDPRSRARLGRDAPAPRGARVRRRRRVRRGGGRVPQPHRRHALPRPADARPAQGARPAIRREPPSGRRVLPRDDPSPPLARRRRAAIRVPSRPSTTSSTSMPRTASRATSPRRPAASPSRATRSGSRPRTTSSRPMPKPLEGDPVSAFGAVVGFNAELDEATARELILNSYEGVVAPGYSAAALRGPRRARAISRSCRCRPRAPTGWPTTASRTSTSTASRAASSSRRATARDRPRPAQRRDPPPPDARGAHRPALRVAGRPPRHEQRGRARAERDARGRRRRPGQPPDGRRDRAPSSRGPGRQRACSRPTPTSRSPTRSRSPPSAASRAIIQPGGSRRDEMAIEIADRHHLAMVFTGRRHFRH